MIVKTFEINKKKIEKQSFFLVYGENEGLKKEVIKSLQKNLNGIIDSYDEAQIIVQKKVFLIQKLF